jgi:hypothetical protein
LRRTECVGRPLSDDAFLGAASSQADEARLEAIAA